MLMNIVYPDRPSGLSLLFGLIPKDFQECVNVFPVSNYEQMISATAASVQLLEKHFKKTGIQGWGVFEMVESYWTFSQDYYCRLAYGESMGEYFAEMQSVLSKDKASQAAAYESFAGPFGGPWPIVKFLHNYNWIDKLKRMNFNIVFTSELKTEENKDSIFSELGFRPAGEKHLQHKFDTIIYLSHKGDNFFMKPYKLTGYRKRYGEMNITDKNGYEEHKKAQKRLADMGLRTSKIEDLEIQAGIKPPKLEEKTITMISKTDESKISKTELTEQPKKEAPKDDWNI